MKEMKEGTIMENKEIKRTPLPKGGGAGHSACLFLSEFQSFYGRVCHLTGALSGSYWI